MERLATHRLSCRVSRMVISNLITRFDNIVARSVKSYRDGESIFPSYLRNYFVSLNERIVRSSVAIEKIFWMGLDSNTL